MKYKKYESKLNFIIDKLVSRRKELGLSHEKLADLTGLNRSAISLIESRKRVPSIITLMRICDGLDISLADLIRKADDN